MSICCQKDGWCTTKIIEYWLNNIFLPYQRQIIEKCLLVFDKATCHISKEAIDFLNYNNIPYIFIPAGMTPYCQPLDIAVNKVFKDNVKLNFEKDRLFYDNINPKIKLNTLRIKLLDIINKVWNDESIISKKIIVNGFNKSGIIGNKYLSIEDEKVSIGYLYDLNLIENNEIINNISEEINIENILDEYDEENDEEEENSDKIKEKNNISYNYKSDLENLNNVYKNQIEDDLMDLE